MRLLDNLERLLRPFAVPNLTLVIVACQAASFLIWLVNRELALSMTLNPWAVLNGEVWRLFTFPLVNPGLNIIFAIFYFYLFYMFGTTLEQQWGVVRFNLYLLIGYLATVGVTMLAAVLSPEGAESPIAAQILPMTSTFLYGSIFLAFAHLYPDFELRLMFILPVKVKWLALLQGFFYLVTFVQGLRNPGGWIVSLAVVASVLNYLLFFGGEAFRRIYYMQRRAQWQAKVARAPNEPRHQCTICGVTDVSNPEMDFRYCTKCVGTPAYCEEHLRNHEHITEAEPAAQAEPANKPIDEGARKSKVRHQDERPPRLFE